jgi:hypothetical protein
MPSIIRIAWPLLASLLATTALAETAEVRAAKYYAQGLDRPLRELRTGVMLIQACVDKLKRACDDEQRRLAAGSQVLALLDELTLFPQDPPADGAGITRAQQLKRKISDTSAQLMREAGGYDLALIARFGGTLLACPPERDVDAFHGSLIALRLVELTGFQGLPVADAEAASSANIAEMEREAGKWRAQPREDCEAARTVGEYLMELMNSKLQPWSAPPPAGGARDFDFAQPKKPSPKVSEDAAEKRELARAVAGNFIAVVATELQLLAFPESAPRIKALADQAGFPSQD